MNRRNMTISFQDWKLTIMYDYGAIQKAVVPDYTGLISFYNRNGESFTCDISEHIRPDAVFLKAYGVSVAEDGSCFLIQNWEKGLFCFALPSGELLWRSKRKHATRLVLLSNQVICHFAEQCVDAMDIHSGEILSHYPLGWNAKFLPLNDVFYLAGPKRGKYHVLDYRLEVQEVIAYQQLNPALLDTCHIVDAVATPGGMTISGFEYMNDYHHEQNLVGNTAMEQYKFSRFIPLNCFRQEQSNQD